MVKVKKILALMLAAISVVSFSGCIANFGFLKYTDNIFELTTANTQGLNNPQNDIQTTNSYVNNQQTLTPSQNTDVITTVPQQNNQQTETTTVSGQTQETTTAAPENNDPSSWTTAEILKYVTEAVTKTKAYTAQVTVDHTEAFSANVTKAPGGAMVKNIANDIIESVVKPTDEVLTFNGGQTVNGEGETVPLLLPKRGAFTLTADGIASATAKKSGNDVSVKITLVQEVGTLTDHPKHQAASVGYLDASDVDLGPVKLNYLNITYIGTTLDLVINSNGYVNSAVYKIPIKVECEGSVMGATAQVECEGEQSEAWKINW